MPQQLEQSLQVPETPCPLTEAELSEFVKQIPPLETIVCIMQLLICMRELQNLGINTITIYIHEHIIDHSIIAIGLH